MNTLAGRRLKSGTKSSLRWKMMIVWRETAKEEFRELQSSLLSLVALSCDVNYGWRSWSWVRSRMYDENGVLLRRNLSRFASLLHLIISTHFGSFRWDDYAKCSWGVRGCWHDELLWWWDDQSFGCQLGSFGSIKSSGFCGYKVCTCSCYEALCSQLKLSDKPDLVCAFCSFEGLFSLHYIIASISFILPRICRIIVKTFPEVFLRLSLCRTFCELDKKHQLLYDDLTRSEWWANGALVPPESKQQTRNVARMKLNWIYGNHKTDISPRHGDWATDRCSIPV